jgi:hypothetical protein
MHLVVPGNAPENSWELVVRNVLTGPKPCEELAPAKMGPRGDRGKVRVRSGGACSLGFLVEARPFRAEELCDLHSERAPAFPPTS